MKTPEYHSLTLAATTYGDISAYGRFVRLVTITGAATIQMAFDDDLLQTFNPGISIDCENWHYKRIRFYNPAGVPVTVTTLIGDTRVYDDSQGLSSMVASLAAIEARLAGVAAMTQPAIITLPATGAGGQQIFAANASRRRLSIQAALTNTGTVYLGRTAVNCTDADCFAMLAPGQPCPEDYYTGAVFGVGNDAAQQVVCYEI